MKSSEKTMEATMTLTSVVTEELLSNERSSLCDWSLSRIENIAGIPLLQHFQPVDHGYMLSPFWVLEVIS